MPQWGANELEEEEEEEEEEVVEADAALEKYKAPQWDFSM